MVDALDRIGGNSVYNNGDSDDYGDNDLLRCGDCGAWFKLNDYPEMCHGDFCLECNDGVLEEWDKS